MQYLQGNHRIEHLGHMYMVIFNYMLKDDAKCISEIGKKRPFCALSMTVEIDCWLMVVYDC